MTELDRLFEEDGMLARGLPGYSLRSQQVAMAHDIDQVLKARGSLLVEAGTGTGKTLAYLVPALASNLRVIVATGTKTLQDQLYYKDVPLALKVTGGGGRASLLKGRSNYLCPQRLDRHLKTIAKDTPQTLQGRLGEVRTWYSGTRTGDITEVIDVESDSFLLPYVTSTVDNCLGSDCPQVNECPLYRARARAAESDLVVVNHHLLFADFALQDDNISSLLPEADAIIIDEAHQVADVARQFFGSRVGSGQLAELCRDVLAEMQLLGNDDARLVYQVERLRSAIDALGVAFERIRGSDFSLALADPVVCEAVETVDINLGDVAQLLDVAAARSRVLASCYQRAHQLSDRFAMLTEENHDDTHAHWLERHGRGYSIHLAPVSIADEFGGRVAASDKAWIFTSATLTIGNRFDHIRRTLGLETTPAERYESPFDYQQQVGAFVPRLTPRPGTDDHTHALLDVVLPLIRRVPGRTFFLFTSYRALDIAAARFRAETGLSFIVQGQQPRPMLLAQFARIDNCVLLATQSFWEGVDVRGANLRCLIIDKLPFANPDDTFTRARMKVLAAAGGNGFADVMIPEAAITLCQGFGRLIRQESDRGLFVLGDSRIVTQGYGAKFVETLPPLTWLESADAAMRYLEELEADEPSRD